MTLSPQFLDDLKARLTLSDVVGRRVKLQRAGREYTGLCPFHNEKTPSFTVNDQKGFYHCFGCGEHGSVIDFVMATEGVEFLDAVERLAEEAGVEMPARDPRARARAERQASLTEVMEVAARWYCDQLTSKAGKEALGYVKRRGLGPAAIDRFRLGYAPGGGTATRATLKEAMLARGITVQQLVDCGMLIQPDGGGEPYDRFRDRLMFPIEDRRGRIIAFGARALSAAAKAKYLNSPDTPLFHKGRTLYNWHRAREAAHRTGQIVVVEGYMDVIALSEAGLDQAVAPLGTAVTEDQIAHLWAMADEPVLAFDGDKAGMRAAARAAERALPLLRPGKSLRLLFMEKGYDPDTLVREQGRSAFDALIDQAQPLSSFLWSHLTADVDVSTPERRAGLQKSVSEALGHIQDDNIRHLYAEDFAARLGIGGGLAGMGGRAKSSFVAGLQEAPQADVSAAPQSRSQYYNEQAETPANRPPYRRGFQDRASSGRESRGLSARQNPSMVKETKRQAEEKRLAWKQRQRDASAGYGAWQESGKLAGTALGQVEGSAAYLGGLERFLILTCIHHPALLTLHEEAIGGLQPSDEGLKRILDGILGFMTEQRGPLDQEHLESHLRAVGAWSLVQDLRSDAALKIEWSAWPEAALSDAVTAFEHCLGRYHFLTQAEAALRAAQEAFNREATQAAWDRLMAAQQALSEAKETDASKRNYGLESNRLRD